jgi:opacity protein-like surface antigen
MFTNTRDCGFYTNILLDSIEFEIIMKKTLLLLISLFASSHIFSTPFSFSNFYIDGFAGVNFINSRTDDNIHERYNVGYAVGGALGYSFSRHFRVEGEISYRRNTIDEFESDYYLSASGHIEKLAFMGNVLLDIPLCKACLIPYLGIGLGGSWDKTRFTFEPICTYGDCIYVFNSLSGTSWEFVCQGIAGLTFAVREKVCAAMEYRYLGGPYLIGDHTLALNLKCYF